MADQFDKETILAKFREKAQAKGFELHRDKSKMSNGYPAIEDLLDAVAEALADIFHNEDEPGVLKAQNFKIGPSGIQKPAAYKDGAVKADIVSDPAFFTWIETFHGLLQGVYPEPGNGAPDVFAMALKSLLAQKPTSITAKIIDGTDKVKVTT